MPLVRPVTLHVVAGAETVQVAPLGLGLGLAVTVYSEMTAPPVILDAAHDTLDMESCPLTAFVFVGALGAVAGVAGDEFAE